MFAHNLEPLDIGLLNYLDKYASLLCPQNSPTPVELEMAHIIHWARESKTQNVYKRAQDRGTRGISHAERLR